MLVTAPDLGRSLGLQLRRWLEQEPERLRTGTAIANRLIDALGADDSLRGPIRDLTSRPQLLQALHSQGASQQAAVASLSQQLAQTYAPAVFHQLVDLLEAATGMVGSGAEGEQPLAPAQAGPMATPATREALPPQLGWQALLHAIAPGVALAASAALVFSWLAQELDRRLFDGWGWSGGVVLMLVLGILQALSLGPLRRLRRLWALTERQAHEPREAWRWIGSSWIHTNGVEASVNLVLLLILLGNAPLPLGQIVLRYGLTALACLIPAVLLAHRFGVRRRWSGASGPISAMIALGAALSLLHWRSMGFTTPLLTIPAWVLLLINAAVQLSWQLPRQAGEQTSQAWQRLLCSSWTWGLIFGRGWAVITRALEAL